jgi:hypothetical protein
MTAEAQIVADTVPPDGAPTDIQTLADRRAGEIMRSLSRWGLRRPRDGEQRKVLAKVYQAIRAAQEIDARGGLKEPQRSMVARLLRTEATQIGLDSLLALMDVWDRTLVETRDEPYVRSVLMAEVVRGRRHGKTTVVTWNEVYARKDDARKDDAKQDDAKQDEELIRALQAGSDLDEMQLERGSNRLLQLFRARTALYQLERARDEVSSRLLWNASVIVLALAALLLVALQLENPIWISAAAGALGGCISSTVQVRAAPRRIGALRAYVPLEVLQPLIGASAGLVTFLLLSAGVRNVFNPSLLGGTNSWAVYGLVAFVAGFSEPRFLKTVDNLADSFLRDEPTQPPADDTQPAPGAAATPDAKAGT